jgi:1-acyl-sn-glycerol-3-phosphate acyltransferase
MIAAIRSAAAMLFAIVATPLAGLIAFPWTWISGSADFIYATALWIAGVGLRIAGVRVQVEGRENLDPSRSYIVMCNHVSNLDPPVLIRGLPRRTSVLVKKELFKIPILGSAMRVGDLVPVDRRNREAAVNSMREAGEVLRRGLNMSVFPEGTRSPDGRLLPFKKGPFYLAMDTGIPIAPVTMLGTERLMPKGSSVIRSGTVRMIIHPPVDPSGFADKDQLIAAVRRQIESALPPALRETDANATL